MSVIRGKVILVDDEAMVRQSTAQWFQVSGFEVQSFACAKTALAAIDESFDGIVVTDVRMPNVSGLELQQLIRNIDQTIPVILLTAHGDVDMAIQALKDGAYDFIEKPFVPERLVEAVDRACQQRQLVLENQRLSEAVVSETGIDSKIIGISPTIVRLKRNILKLAKLDTNVIIYGDTGTGKELVAQCLHDFGKRENKHFVPINCGAIPENLIESELFGHESGAFTGATKTRIGKFEYASQGSLFLDEIESMPTHLQIKLLRALQEGTIERLGANRSINVDLRVIAAAKCELRDHPEFRQDLFYRLNVAELHIPPLKERLEDVPLLFNHYLRLACAAHEQEIRTLSEHDLVTLTEYQWPGNVRELKNVAIRYSLDDEVSVADILMISNPKVSLDDPAELNVEHSDLPLSVQVAQFEAEVIRNALSVNHGSIKATMASLDIPRRTLNQKMIKYGLDRKNFKD